MTRFRSAFVLSLTLFAATASAQIGQGTLTGVVTDPQGQVLPGVTVTATSTALIGIRTAVTETDGRFRFPALPSGFYKLKFDLSGFSTLERDNIQVVLGQTIAVDTQLKIASLAETVTVQGESPVVDVTTTRVGTSLKGEELTAIPNSTDVWGALSEAPGVRMQGFDVGGSHKSQQSSYEVFGVQNQGRVVTEGIDHTEGVGVHRILRGLLRERGVLDQRARQRRRDELGRGSNCRDVEERWEQLQWALPSQLPAGRVGGRQQQRRASCARIHGQPKSPLLGRSRRSGWSNRPGQGVVLRRLQPLQDRQGGLRRVAGASPLTLAFLTTSPAKGLGRPGSITPLSGTTSKGGSRSRNVGCLRCVHPNPFRRRTVGHACTRASFSA